MVIDTVITERLNAILLSLMPAERWQAVRQFDTYFTAARWFTLIMLAALIILIVLFLWVSYKRMVEERKIAEQLFVVYAERMGLTAHEGHILLQVINQSGLKRSDDIFTMEDAFDRGATKLMEQSVAPALASQEAAGAQENEQLRADLSFLREKLGFLPRSSTGEPPKSEKLSSSRQVPIGKKLRITSCRTPHQGGVESTVIKNDDTELTVKLATPLKSKPGEYWRVRFYFSGSVREFDSSVVRCDGDELVLSHTDNVRSINLRRFLRVPVNKPALIARFQFARTMPPDGDRESGIENIESELHPEFFPAVVTELSGLGLRLDVPLEVKVDERVLVIFKLGGKDQSSSSQKNSKMITSKIIEVIGEVRHTEAIENGLSIAVELIGLSDSDINELVCAVNAAWPRADVQRRGTIDEGRGTKVAEPADFGEPRPALGGAATQGA